MRIFHAVANTSPTSEVQNGVKGPLSIEETFKIILLFDIEFLKAKVFGIFMAIELTQSPFFETNVVIIVKVVDTDYMMPIVKQFPTYPRSDKACSSSNEIFLTQA